VDLHHRTGQQADEAAGPSADPGRTAIERALREAGLSNRFRLAASDIGFDANTYEYRASFASSAEWRELESAWKAFAKGDVAKAIATAQKQLEDPELAAAAQTAIDAFEKRTNARIDRAKWALDNGFIVDAIARLENVEDAVKGAESLEQRVAELLAHAKGDELAAERSADEKLAKFLEELYEEGFDSKGKMRNKLSKIAEDLGDTKAGERARHILRIAPAE